MASVFIGIAINNGIFSSANEASFKSRMGKFQEDTITYDALKNFEMDRINSGNVLKAIIESELITDIEVTDVNIPITDILGGINKNEQEYCVVYKGKLHYVSNDNVNNNDKQTQWCREIGIPILEFTPSKGIAVRDGSYEEVDGLYINTPNVDIGFVKEETRYLYESNGKMVPGNWTTSRPPNNWYNYSQGKWANIYVEAEGREVYYVWIPRYCFKIDETKTERTDIKFISLNNEYKYLDGETEKTKSWSELENEGYTIPDAFWWDKNNNGTREDDEQLAGFWAAKYEVGQATDNTTINFDMITSKNKVTIKNIIPNSSSPVIEQISSYTIAVNGKIVKTITDINNINYDEMKFTSNKNGLNHINLTALNENGEIVGSMTKTTVINLEDKTNPPVLAGFKPETTFYVTYDENGNENSTIPITQAAPEGWYDYDEGKWANIVTRNNDAEVYYVWIPRYQYKLDSGERTMIDFIKGTSTETKDGFAIPDAFWWDKNNDGVRDADEQLKGFWAMKYEVANT